MNYKYYRKDKQRVRCGGEAIYIKEDILAVEITMRNDSKIFIFSACNRSTKSLLASDLDPILRMAKFNFDIQIAEALLGNFQRCVRIMQLFHS